jgi:hypothetical protein
MDWMEKHEMPCTHKVQIICGPEQLGTPAMERTKIKPGLQGPAFSADIQ